MKKVALVTLAILMWSGVALGQEWHTANQVTLGWDAVTQLVDGTAIPEGEIVKYKVWIKNAITGGDPVELVETTDLEFTLTIGSEGKYFLGVQALRYQSDGETLIGESIICWSDVPECCGGNIAFGVQFFNLPASPGGLGLK